jgi:Leucine-rich repeat (LRR) protein
MASTTPSTFVEGNPGDLITDEIIREEIINLYGTWLRFDKLSEDIRNNINDQHILYVLNHNLVDSQRSQIIPSQKAGWIYLSGCIEITDQSLINIANKCPLLITLLIDGCVKITATGIAAITEKFGAKLVTLHYSGCVNCGNVAFESIVMQCTQLKVLEARNTGITVIPEMIGEKLPKLLTLDLSNNNIKRVPPSISQLLNRLPKPRVNIDTKSLENIPSFANKLQLKNTFQNGPGPTCGFLGQTQKGWGPEMWGITLHQIEEVLNYPLIHSKTLMRDVVRLAIKPATKQCQVGYALLLNQDKPLHANVMVSVSTCT